MADTITTADAQAALNPAQVQAATDALVAATQTGAAQAGQQIDTNQQQLAPGLNSGQNAPGGYNYARNIAPVVDPLTSSLVVSAKQAVLRNALKDATNTANSSYVDAQSNYQARQRAFNVAQAEKSRERQRQQDAAAAAQLALASGGGGGIGDTTTSENSKQYIGNNDLRGRLNYLAQNGDANAKIALSFVGNDGKYSLSPSDPRYKQAIGALNAIGATNVYKAAAPKATAPANQFGGSFNINSLTNGSLNPLYGK